MESGKSESSKVIGDISKENLDVAIVDALQKEQRVVVPDFGYLELISLSDKFTVLFRAVNQQNLFVRQSFDESQGEDIVSVIYDVISIPLKEGKVVSLPKLGVFRSIKQSDGNLRISFVPSSFLRKQLNGIEPEEITKSSTCDLIEDEIVPDKTVPVVSFEESNSENKKSKIESDLNEVSVPKASVFEVSVPEDVSMEEDSTMFQYGTSIRKKRKSLRVIFVLGICIAVFIIFILSLWKDEGEQDTDTFTDYPSQSLNLLDLAEQHYGNSIFWVYIYDANRSKLTSPVNIPKGITLTIPDLSQPEYNVDVKDSLEIQRAIIRSENILK